MPFSEAFAPWLPTLQDIEVRKNDVDVGDYYQRFGWENLVVPNDCPHITSRMPYLKPLFEQRYAFRMVNQESLERWQIKLQAKFDEIVHIYERAYVLYEKYEQEMLDDMIGGEKIFRDISGDTSGDTSAVNTPDYATNLSDDYADNRSRSKVKETRKETITSQRTGDGLVDSVNAGYQRWVDIDQALIAEFENNFLNVFFY
jgi:hypothetical protein